MIQLILLTLASAAHAGFSILWEAGRNGWLALSTFAHTRLRPSASPHAKDGDRRSLEDETRRQWDDDDDEDLFI